MYSFSQRRCGASWMWLSAAIVASLLIPAFSTASPPASAENDSAESKFEQSWQVLLIAGQRIGFAHNTHRERKVGSQTIVEINSLTEMKISRFGQSLEMKQMLHVEETPEGHLLRFTSVTDNPPNSRVSSQGVVEGDTLTLTTRAGGTETRSVLTGMRNVLSPSYSERYLSEHELAVGEKASFETFDPQFAKTATVTLERLPETATRLLDGSLVKATHIKMSQSVPGAPSITMDLFRNESGEAIKMSSPLLGLEAFEVSEEEARKEFDGGKVDLALGTVVAVDIPKSPHTASEMTYRIRVEGSDPSELFVTGTTQHLKQTGDNEILLTVRSLRPEAIPSGQANTEVAEQYTRASRFLECESATIRQLAEDAVGKETDPVRMAVDLERYVGTLVEDKNFSTAMATALEVAQNRAGDCSEHAVLLAALLRARDIPSRVAIGFVYSARHKAFVGHMWTEARLGDHWVPLDATLSQGGIGAGHITVSTSSLSEPGSTPVAEFIPLLHLLGRMTIEVVDRE